MVEHGYLNPVIVFHHMPYLKPGCIVESNFYSVNAVVTLCFLRLFFLTQRRKDATIRRER